MNPDVLISICTGLSLITSCLTLLFVVINQKLRQSLFTKIVIYLSISSIVQGYNYLFSIRIILVFVPILLVSEFMAHLVYCFGTPLQYIVLGQKLIYLRKIALANQDSGSLQDLQEEYRKLVKLEKSFLSLCFGLPFLMVLWPLISDPIISSKEGEQNFCYIYFSKNDNVGQKVSADLKRLLIWDVPYFGYFIFCGVVLSTINKLFLDMQLNQANRKFILKQALFPLITFICTIGFTVEDIENLFFVQVPEIQTTINICMIGIWGFLNALAYLFIGSLYKEISKSCCYQKPDQLLPNEIPNPNSKEDEQDTYYYQGSFDWQIEDKKIEIQLNIL